jgi:hypothetical protein
MLSVKDELLNQLPWLEGRCRAVAASFRGTDPGDVIQNVVAEFLDRAAGGWFAAARTLLAFCVRHELSRLVREARRRGDLGLPECQEGEESPFESLPAGLSDPERIARARGILAAIAALTPPRRLALLAIEVPDGVELDDIECAAAFPDGGNRMVVRDPSEAWALLQAAREALDLRRKAAAWKRAVAEILMGTGPLGTIEPERLKKAVQVLEKALSRARAGVLEHVQ